MKSSKHQHSHQRHVVIYFLYKKIFKIKALTSSEFSDFLSEYITLDRATVPNSVKKTEQFLESNTGSITFNRACKDAMTAYTKAKRNIDNNMVALRSFRDEVTSTYIRSYEKLSPQDAADILEGLSKLIRKGGESIKNLIDGEYTIS